MKIASVLKDQNNEVQYVDGVANYFCKIDGEKFIQTLSNTLWFLKFQKKRESAFLRF